MRALKLSELAPKDPGEKRAHKRNQFPRGTSGQSGQKASKNNPPDVDGHNKRPIVRRWEENPALEWERSAPGSEVSPRNKKPLTKPSGVCATVPNCNAVRPGKGLSILSQL